MVIFSRTRYDGKYKKSGEVDVRAVMGHGNDTFRLCREERFGLGEGSHSRDLTPK
jgi:hypothetical protein